jgi:hypothetical protein
VTAAVCVLKLAENAAARQPQKGGVNVIIRKLKLEVRLILLRTQIQRMPVDDPRAPRIAQEFLELKRELVDLREAETAVAA